MNATPRFLLEGSYYALVQCGRLLTSAAILYKTEEYATAVGLAALAHEELGRSRYLRKQREEVVKGKVISIEEIREVCKDHVMKQEWGQVSVIQRFSRDSGLGNLVRAGYQASPQSKEFQEARQQLDDVAERQKGRVPQDRHTERMRAFYVEPTDLGMDWHKPWEKDKEAAHHFIENALNDYGMQRNNRWLLEIIKLDDPELGLAVDGWIDRPALPPSPSLY